jgi:hypothetical protein
MILGMGTSPVPLPPPGTKAPVLALDDSMSGCAIPLPHLNALGDPILEHWYAKYNHLYFQDRLAPSPIVIWSKIYKRGEIGVSFWRIDPPIIMLDPHLKKLQVYALLTLLHEMEHGEQSLKGGKDWPDHGDAFNTGMKRLAQDGAFKDLW